jgi:hypothetical protein
LPSLNFRVGIAAMLENVDVKLECAEIWKGRLDGVINRDIDEMEFVDSLKERDLRVVAAFIKN